MTMSSKNTQDQLNKKDSGSFRTWMDGTNDPYLGSMEMQPQPEPHDPELKYQGIDVDGLKRRVWYEEKSKSVSGRGLGFIITSSVICALIIALLCYAITFMPPLGNPNNPTVNTVPEKYISDALKDTGSENVVTGMILTYRGFDTFGETTVLFAATCCVMLLLSITDKEERKKYKLDEEDYEPAPDGILRASALIIVPLMTLFGIYVILNGKASPGGGFAGGAIMGAGLVLSSIAFGTELTSRWINERVFKIIRVTALLTYGIDVGWYFITGANGLPAILPLSLIQEIADICVGIVVACTVYSFYALFRRGGMQ